MTATPLVMVEEHWTFRELDHALRHQPADQRDPSVVLNDRGDIPERLLDIGSGRIAAMDAAGIQTQILSLHPPGTQGLALPEATALSREANDRMSAAAAAHPDRFAALTALPLGDPAAALSELQRSAALPGHVGVMVFGRSGTRALDDPAYDELLGAVAALRRPLFLHPQIPVAAVREAVHSGFDPLVNLSLSTFGWGWHIEAGLAALRLILAGTFDRHPDLQIILGHWGEMLLFALDRIDSLSNVATHLERRVADYMAANLHIATSGMFVPRLLRQALDYTGADRILLSGDYPFHRPDATSVGVFLDALDDPADRARLAHGNAQRLFGLGVSA